MKRWKGQEMEPIHREEEEKDKRRNSFKKKERELGLESEDEVSGSPII
jgi:hypothetical protein